MAGAFSCNSLFSFHRLYYAQDLPLPLAPGTIPFLFFLCAALCFGGVFSGRRTFGIPFLAVTLISAGVALLDLLLHHLPGGGAHEPFHWLLITLVFGAWGILGRERSVSPRSRKLLRLASLSSSASFFLLFFYSLLPESPFDPIAGLFRHMMLAASLVAVARLIEVETADLGVQFVIRLNGIFIVLAACIVIVVVSVQEREYFKSVSRDALNMTELLQNHFTDLYRRSGDIPAFLNHSEVGDQITVEFSRRPTLLSVAIRIRDLQMVVLREHSGELAHRIGRAPPRREPPTGVRLLKNNRFRVSRPFFLDGERKVEGRMEMTESMVEINREVAGLILVIFVVFLVLVLLSSVPIAMTVAQASDTIREQYQELEHTHQQLLQAAKSAAVGEMAGGMAHELNNPLGVILGRASYLKAMTRNDGNARFLEDLEVIERSASRASRIIGDLLDFARPHRLSCDRHDINLIVSETVQLIKPRLADRQITLTTAFSPVVEAVVDADRLQQVLVNLFNNAIDACDEKGCIEIRTECAPGSDLVTITVTDDGIGMSEENLKNIFDPFYTTKAKGTGLGLSVSYRIIRDHGGQIVATSQEGVGSCFRVTLSSSLPGGEP